MKHWIKNLFLFSAPFFGGTLFSRDVLSIAIPVFFAFSFTASSLYIFNDIQDMDSDRFHPRKRSKPIASGEISRSNAYILSSVLLFISLIISYKININYFYFILSYIAIQVSYSIYLKKIPIIDIFCISSGFVIRVFAGGEAFNVKISSWLFLTMFMIALVLASGKRYSELEELKENAQSHRKSLKYYNRRFLMDMLIVSASSSLICYALYILEQSRNLIYTLPVVTFGLFRYLMLSEKGLGDPTEAIMRDFYLFLTVVLWLALVWLVRY